MAIYYYGNSIVEIRFPQPLINHFQVNIERE